MHATCVEIKFVVMYPPRKVVRNFIRKSPVRKALLILHESLTCAHADNAMQPKETKILALGIQLHLLNPHVVLGNLYIRSLYEKMAKRQSSLVNFFSKRARNEGELVIFLIQKCSKVN